VATLLPCRSSLLAGSRSSTRRSSTIGCALLETARISQAGRDHILAHGSVALSVLSEKQRRCSLLRRDRGCAHRRNAPFAYPNVPDDQRLGGALVAYSFSVVLGSVAVREALADVDAAAPDGPTGAQGRCNLRGALGRASSKVVVYFS